MWSVFLRECLCLINLYTFKKKNVGFAIEAFNYKRKMQLCEIENEV